MFSIAHIYLYGISTFLLVLVLFTVRINAQYNTMSSSVVRVTQYVPKVVDKTCLLKPQYGPCRANVEMYYFDPAAMNCSIFRWGGCQGNGNRFDSFAECQTTCLGLRSVSKRRPKYCSLSFDYGFCFGAVFRYYYDPLWKVCKQRIYSGCGGNLNNFYSFEQCESVCRFGNGELTVDDNGHKKHKKKVVIVNPWQHTKTTQDPKKNITLTTSCGSQTIPTTTADPEDCFRRKNNLLS